MNYIPHVSTRGFELYLVRQIPKYTDKVSSCLILPVVLMNCLLHAHFHTSHSFGLTQGPCRQGNLLQWIIHIRIIFGHHTHKGVHCLGKCILGSLPGSRYHA